MDFVFACALTVGIEAAALFLLLRGRYEAALIARNAAIASSLTLPFVWFAFPALGLGWGMQTALAEAFAALAEAGIYAFAFKGIKPEEALLASVLCNWCSFIIGLAMA
ncbi:hypothetical protein L0Y65_04725 [Candidatus Micrarchaeota archaeon]|nr:hypothetical protein [Candidatus Micrarchaeota archaeon]